MKKILISFSFFTFCFSLVYSQHSTCQKALEVTSTDIELVPTTPAPDQWCAERNSGGRYFEMEHNVVWFTFLVPEDTLLTFDIIPSNPGDDLDFLLFKEAANGQFCSHLDIINNHDPVRTNLSKVKVSTKSTGLSKASGEEIVPRSSSSNYSKALEVKKGERYYLVVDDRTQSGSVNLKMHLNFNKTNPKNIPQDSPSYIDANPIKAPRVQAPSPQDTIGNYLNKPAPMAPKLTRTLLVVNVTDSSGNPVKAELNIEGVSQGKTLTIVTDRDTLPLDPLQTININCNAVGYVFTSASYIAPDAPIMANINLTLSRIRQGQSIVLKGIEFEEGNAKFLASSNAPLMNVASFLRNNLNVNVLIKGYVNKPYGGNSSSAIKLSKQRAEAVRDDLHANGIAMNRMSCKGFGNQGMLFPNPVNKEQVQANRRVEIEIR